MRKVFAFEEIDIIHQNLSSIEDEEGIFILNNRGDIIFTNRKARCIYGLRNEIKRCLKNKKIILRKKNNEIVIYPIFEKNDIKFFFGVIRNMEEIIKMKKYVNSVYEKLRLFKENISHYFFNPLIIAKGYLDLLLDKEIDKEDKIKIRKVKNAIERIENVIRNIVVEDRIAE